MIRCQRGLSILDIEDCQRSFRFPGVLSGGVLSQVRLPGPDLAGPLGEQELGQLSIRCGHQNNFDAWSERRNAFGAVDRFRDNLTLQDSLFGKFRGCFSLGPLQFQIARDDALRCAPTAQQKHSIFRPFERHSRREGYFG